MSMKNNSGIWAFAAFMAIRLGLSWASTEIGAQYPVWHTVFEVMKWIFTAAMLAWMLVKIAYRIRERITARRERAQP